VLFTEDHEEVWDGDRPTLSTVTYRSPDDTIIARKTVTYGGDPCIPGFELVDLRDGYKEGAALVDDGVELFCRKSQDEPLRHKRLDLPRDAAMDEGSLHFVQRHWDELAAGRTVKLHFAVPYRQEFFAFRIVPEEPQPLAALPPGGPPTLGFRLEVASRLLRFLVDPVHLIYDPTTRRLLHFAGITALNDEDGHSHRARILFEYPAGS
ncbi:MAG: hypothetical protein SX243_21035, partial [Acidobacteriota bacterium]|nr:hypothetical protein [Acidobacteriota bacterium]